jgi:hypothetical protein
VFVLVLCYVAFVVVHNISPTAIEQDAQRRATATAQSAIQVDAGATVVEEIRVAATQTARAILTATPIAVNGNGSGPQWVLQANRAKPAPAFQGKR